MGNKFHNFETDQPEEGYLFISEKNVDTLIGNYGDTYAFELLTATPNVIGELSARIVLYSFSKEK